MRPLYDLASVFTAEILQAESEGTKVYEPVVGMVTDNKDPDKLGRVKVKMPVLSGADTSHWVPIVMLGAGKNRGWFFIPEVDDEVLVIFEHGNINKPMVIGAMWGGKDKPPDKNPGPNPRRVIKSRQGSKITFDDENKKLIIEDGTKKAKITFDAEGKKIIIEALEEDVCFQSPKGDMTIVAKSWEIEAKKNIEFHAGTNIQWGVGSAATVRGGTIAATGSTASQNCGVAQDPPAAQATPEEVADPYGS